MASDGVALSNIAAVGIATCVSSQRSNATRQAARDADYHQVYGGRCPQYGQTPTCNVIFDSW